MYKNTTHTAEITAFSSEGAGIAKIDGYTVFVPSAVVGDIVKLVIVKENKHYGYGKILEIITPSPLRTIPLCGIFGKCGGCGMMSVKYECQLDFKYRKVSDAIERIGGFRDVEFDEIMPSNPNIYYRNKAQYPVASFSDGIKAGFYAPHSHRVVPADNCVLQDKRSNDIAAEVTKWANKNGVSAYDEEKHRGILRHICVRCGKKEAVLVLVVTEPLKNLHLLIELLIGKFPFIVGIVENYNNKPTNVIYGDKDKVLFGVPYIYDSIGNITYKVHYRSFYQVNPYTTLSLYEKALEYASPDKTETVFDLYCGTGTISLFLARKAKKVIGIEIIEEAVINAKENAALNEINNVQFHCGEAEKAAPKLIENGEKADIVVLDPPRKGCDERLLDAIGAMKPEKIVYVSCDCATMARDAAYLKKYGYTIKKAAVCDQFPHTAHVETVVLMSRVKE